MNVIFFIALICAATISAEETRPINFTLLEKAAEEPLSSLTGFTLSDVGKGRWTLSWTTDTEEFAHINYGTSPSNLDTTAYDVRGESFLGTTHYITASGLAAYTVYYFDISSGGTVYDNNGEHYALITGKVLSPNASSDLAYGSALLSRPGVSPAAGAIAYIRLTDKDGLGTLSDSHLYSSLVDVDGYWHLDLENIKNKSLDSYFDYSYETDGLSIEIRGGEGDCASQTLYTSERRPAPTVTLEQDIYPVVTIREPINCGISRVNYLTVRGNVSNNASPVTSALLILDEGDGQVVGVENNEFNYRFSQLTSGVKTLTVKVTDAAGRQGSATITVPVLVGDVNKDGVVNILDLITIRKTLNKRGADITPANADVNGDDIVNILDLIVVRANLNKLLTAL